MTPGREALVLAAACGLLYLTGVADIPFYTRGEPREGLVVREMEQSGEWLVPRRPGGRLAPKPPLYYWAGAVAIRALPERPELALRLPNALGATAGVFATWAAARAAWGPAAALPAALVLATAFEWVRAATTARVDMALAAPLAGVLAAWTVALARPARGTLAVAALGAALGTLAKGPVALVLPALAAVLLVLVRPGALRALRPAATLALAAAVAGVWYAAALVHAGPAFLDVLVRENWLRFLDTEAAATGHAHGPGYLPLLGLVGLLPWVPLLPLAGAARGTPALLAACWAAGGLVFFSLAAAKRSVYLLPLVPALALLVGAGVAGARTDGRLAAIARLAALVYVPAFAALALVAGAVAAGVDPSAPIRPLLRPADATGATAVVEAARAAALGAGLLAAATAGGAVLLAGAARRAAWSRVVGIVAALAVAWVAFFDATLHPAVARARSLETFLARVDAALPADAVLHTRFPPDPGLRFYAPRPLRRWPPGAPPPAGYLLVWEDERRGLAEVATREALVTSDVARARHGRLVLLAPPARDVNAP